MGQLLKQWPVTTVVEANAVDNYADQIYSLDEEGDPVIDAATGDPVLAEGASIRELSNGDMQITYNEFDEVPVTINIQSILDGILPQLIPLALTLMLYFFFVKRNWTPLKGIGLLLILGLLGSGLGIWPSIW